MEPIQGTPTKDPASSPIAPPSLKDSIQRICQSEPHRAYTAEELLPILKLQAPKDPEKQAQALDLVKSHLNRLAEEGPITEVSPGLFKFRLYFDKERHIEHAYIGGMGNTLYRFRSPVFRLNIGVLSVFFIFNRKAGTWLATVRDATLGKDYGLVHRIHDGVYRVGSRPPHAGETDFLQIEGRYIAKEHLTLTFLGDAVSVSDHMTPNGTRFDFLTKEGLARYQEAAEAFLRSVDPANHHDPFHRGRFVMERLLKDHQNFEATFFTAMVDYLLAG
jgi:hypothetical protein